MVNLNSKVEDLNDIYADHDTKYQELRQKCLLAEQKAQTISQIGQNWKNKVEKSQEGLVAFEMAQVYEKIADTLTSAHDKSVDLLKNYTNADKELEDLVKQTTELKSKGQELAQKANEEIEKKDKAETEYTNLNNQYQDLDKKSKDLAKNLEKIDQWINKTLSSDQTLSNLKTELDNQQTDLSKNEEKAADLIRKVQSLETLRGSLPKPQNGEDESPSGEQLLKSIEISIDNLKSSSPKINDTIQDLLEQNNFNSELELISKEIYDLKILIENTRQVVNEIKVAVNFTDSTVLNLKPPVDLHPSMSTSSSIYIKTKETFAPIALFYNESNPNEYISLYIKQGRPHFQYKLSSEGLEPNVLSTNSTINDGEWHKIEIERVGKLAKLKVYSENNYQEETKSSEENSVVFNLDPNGAKFVLGQFPYSQIPNDLRTVAALNNQFRGAMDSARFNGQQLGLWNYISAKNIKGEINRKFVASNDQNQEVALTQDEKGVYYMEDAFFCKNYTLRSKIPVEITLKFKSDSPNGLLWLWKVDDNIFYAIYLESGHINVLISFSTEQKYYFFNSVPSISSYRLDDTKYHTIQVTLARDQRKNQFKIAVAERIDQENTNKIGEVVFTTNEIFKLRGGKHCIGGMEAIDRDRIYKDAMFNSFSGCFVSVMFNSDFINLNDKLHKPDVKSSNIVPDCPVASDQCEIKSSSAPVYLQFDVKTYSDEIEHIGVSFSTSKLNGVLFYRVQDKYDNTNRLLLQLKDGHLVLTVYDLDTSYSVKSDQKAIYNDNRLHHVYVIQKQDSLELYVDNKLEGSTKLEESRSNLIETNTLFIAGVPEPQRKVQEQFENFEGCLIKVIYNDNNLDISKSDKRSNSIKFSKCYKTPIRSALLDMPGYKELQNTVLISRYSQKIKQQQADLLSNQECTLSKQYDTSQLKSVGLRFGLTKQSRLEVHETFPIKISTFVSFKFRTLQSEGLMFYASDSQFNDFISVWLANGYVNYAFDCGSGFMHIKTMRTYNDGRYHTVVIKRDKQAGTLTISDRTNTTVLETIENISIGESSSLSVEGPFYFGNIADTDKLQLPAAQLDLIATEPFVGCMSDFNIAYKLLRNNLERVDLMNCSNNHESGIFFTGHGLTSYASLQNSVSLRDAFEISFELKSRTKNGVVLYLGGSKESDLSKNYALVELVNGELLFKLNIDGQENLVKYMPDFSRNELCNSSWIRIKLKKNEKGLLSLELKGVETTNSYLQDISYLAKRLISNSNLFIGSLPQRSLYKEIAQTGEPFVGCIRDVGIKRLNSNGDISQMKVMLDMNLESGVLNYCPLK